MTRGSIFSSDYKQEVNLCAFSMVQVPEVEGAMEINQA